MATPAGWYPDSEQPGQLRYWDGNQWTDHRSPDTGQGAGGPVPQQMAPLAPPPIGGGGYGYGQPGYTSPAGFTPMQVTTPPPSSGGSGCLKAVIIFIVVVILLGGIGTALALVAGHKVVESVRHTFGTANASDYTVTITSCTVDDNGEISASGVFTNHAHRNQAYDLSVFANDAQGIRIDTGDTLIESLGSGQSTHWTIPDFASTTAGSKVSCGKDSVDYSPG